MLSFLVMVLLPIVGPLAVYGMLLAGEWFDKAADADSAHWDYVLRD